MAGHVYQRLRLRGSFVFSLGCTLIGGTFIYSFEAGIFNPSFVADIGLSIKITLPENSIES